MICIFLKCGNKNLFTTRYIYLCKAMPLLKQCSTSGQTNLLKPFASNSDLAKLNPATLLQTIPNELMFIFTYRVLEQKSRQSSQDLQFGWRHYFIAPFGYLFFPPIFFSMLYFSNRSFSQLIFGCKYLCCLCYLQAILDFLCQKPTPPSAATNGCIFTESLCFRIYINTCAHQPYTWMDKLQRLISYENFIFFLQFDVLHLFADVRNQNESKCLCYISPTFDN